MKKLVLIWLFAPLLSWAEPAQPVYTVAYNETTAPFIPLVKAIYIEMGINPVFELVPSERAIALTNNGRYDADLSRVKEALQNYHNIIPTQEPIKSTELYAFAKTGSGITLEKTADLKNHTVALIRGSKLAEYFAHQNGIDAYAANSAHSFYKMLQAGRFEIALITSTQLLTQADQISEVAERIGPVLAKSSSYHILNKKHADLVPRFDAALRAMKADGRAAKYLHQNP